VMLTVLVTGAPLGVTLAGEKVQVAPVGNPEHPRLMGELKPPAGVNVIVKFDACPAVRVKVELLTAMV
jgi:hypothetical protein